jgi:hypothetical protein
MLLDYYETIGECNGGWCDADLDVVKASKEEVLEWDMSSPYELSLYYMYLDNREKMRGGA